MKTSVLATPATATPPGLATQLKKKIELRLSEMCACGYWLCLDCYGINTREEDDHGQPAFCRVCHSHKLELRPPQLELIEPQDLHD